MHLPELEVEAASDIQLLRLASRPCQSVALARKRRTKLKKGDGIKIKQHPIFELCYLVRIGDQILQRFHFLINSAPPSLLGKSIKIKNVD